MNNPEYTLKKCLELLEDYKLISTEECDILEISECIEELEIYISEEFF